MKTGRCYEMPDPRFRILAENLPDMVVCFDKQLYFQPKKSAIASRKLYQQIFDFGYLKPDLIRIYPATTKTEKNLITTGEPGLQLENFNQSKVLYEKDIVYPQKLEL